MAVPREEHAFSCESFLLLEFPRMRCITEGQLFPLYLHAAARNPNLAMGLNTRIFQFDCQLCQSL